MCLYSRLIPNPKYKANNKNGGVIPHLLDRRLKYVAIGCGKCIECTKQKAMQWKTRLMEDIKANTNGKFITLTFSNESIALLTKDIPNGYKGYDKDNAIATLAVRRFLERYRKQNKTSIRHWLITELGHNGTENIHLHGLIWPTKPLEDTLKHWQYGWVWKGNTINGILENYVNETTINYIIKYVTKIDIQHRHYKPIILCSKGIGKNYLNTFNCSQNKFNNTNTKETYTTRTGTILPLPIYFRNKIYTEHEREQLWLQKLDKEERYVLGQKISLKNNAEEVLAALKSAQKLNEELGYGKPKDKKTDWDEYEYEQQLREIKILTRIANAKNEGKAL